MRWAAVGLTVALSVALHSAGPEMALADEPGPTTTTSTTVSAEIIELARNLELLEDLDLLEQWDVLELMPLLEEDDEQ